MSNNYWSKIDLHQHTNHDIDCNGKSLDNNYTHLDYSKWLKVQNVKLKVVTCHNNIDLAEHIKHAIISDFLEINHLVGVEIDYCFDELEFHAITILSPNINIIKFVDTLEQIRLSKNNKVSFDKEDFIKLHTDIEFIFIPHAIKKKGIFQSDIEELETSTIDWVVKSLISGMSEPILFESTQSHHIYSVAEKISKSLKRDDITYDKLAHYIGSDYKFDNDEKRKQKILEKSQYSICSQPTYRGLEIALRNHKTRLSLDDQIIDREKYITEIEISSSEEFEKSILRLSPGLNVIIGDSGSGKTLLLNQILYQIKGRALKAALKNEKESVKQNPYQTKVGNNKLLEIKLDKNYSYEEISILEIPNVYSEILKAQKDENALIEMFGIDNTNNANELISEYKTKVSSFKDNLDLRDLYYKNGNNNFINLSTAIEFMRRNKIENTLFNLDIVLYDDNYLKKTKEKMHKIEKYIIDEEKIKEYFSSLKALFSKNKLKETINEIITKYDLVLKGLEKEYLKTQEIYNKFLFEKKLYEVINNNILKTVDMLGNKEKATSERKAVANKEIGLMKQNLRDLIKTELKQNLFNLAFPYTNLKLELEKNRNEYARLSLNDEKFDIKGINILDNPLFNVNNIKTRIKEAVSNKVDFTNDLEVKELIKNLSNSKIDLSTIINDIGQISKNIEIFFSETAEWKLIDNTNKGDIAKKTIEYYFNDLVKREQPNIILIDQPENDVDKSFITSTLSKFIKDQKIDKQIIVTSHDAIVAINSDVNKIIEAAVTEQNKIKYISYDLEYVREKVLEGTNRVSKILDGGKENIKKRYQIYGGELNYENTNI